MQTERDAKTNRHQGKMPRERDVQSKGFQEKEIKKERVGGRLYIYIHKNKYNLNIYKY